MSDRARIEVFLLSSTITMAALVGAMQDTPDQWHAHRTPTRVTDSDVETSSLFTESVDRKDIGDGLLQDMGHGCYRHLCSTNSDGESYER